MPKYQHFERSILDGYSIVVTDQPQSLFFALLVCVICESANKDSVFFYARTEEDEDAGLPNAGTKLSLQLCIYLFKFILCCVKTYHLYGEVHFTFVIANNTKKFSLLLLPLLHVLLNG